MISDFIKWAENNGWRVIKKEEKVLDLNTEIRERYSEIPYEYQEFLKKIKQLVSPNERTWFLCESDYNNESDCAFRWNEFEIISLDAARNDSEWRAEIISWWDRYLPIIMSVQGGYSFYAIDLYDKKGAIVKGHEPEFEQTKKVADNLSVFFDLIMKNKIKIK